MGSLEGKVAVVTGGASGIGEGTVRLFAAEGAKVIIADIQDARGEKLAEELGTATAFVHCDVSQEADVAAAIDQAVRKWGRLDCMYNNAGFGGVSGPIPQRRARPARSRPDVHGPIRPRGRPGVSQDARHHPRGRQPNGIRRATRPPLRAPPAPARRVFDETEPPMAPHCVFEGEASRTVVILGVEDYH